MAISNSFYISYDASLVREALEITRDAFIEHCYDTGSRRDCEVAGQILTNERLDSLLSEDAMIGTVGTEIDDNYMDVVVIKKGSTETLLDPWGRTCKRTFNGSSAIPRIHMKKEDCQCLDSLSLEHGDSCSLNAQFFALILIGALGSHPYIPDTVDTQLLFDIRSLSRSALSYIQRNAETTVYEAFQHES